MKKSKKLSEQNASPSLLPLPPPPTPLMGLRYGEQSLCRVPTSPVHPHEGAPMRSCCHSSIFEAKSLNCSIVGAFLLLSRGVGFGAKFVSVLCCCKFTFYIFCVLFRQAVFSSCYSWYLSTWNCLQLEFSDNHRLKAGLHLKAVLKTVLRRNLTEYHSSPPIIQPYLIFTKYYVRNNPFSIPQNACMKFSKRGRSKKHLL